MTVYMDATGEPLRGQSLEGTRLRLVQKGELRRVGEYASSPGRVTSPIIRLVDTQEGWLPTT